MATRSINIDELYTLLADNSTSKTGFIPYTITLADGRTIAGLSQLP